MLETAAAKPATLHNLITHPHRHHRTPDNHANFPPARRDSRSLAQDAAAPSEPSAPTAQALPYNEEDLSEGEMMEPRSRTSESGPSPHDYHNYNGHHTYHNQRDSSSHDYHSYDSRRNDRRDWDAPDKYWPQSRSRSPSGSRNETDFRARTGPRPRSRSPFPPRSRSASPHRVSGPGIVTDTVVIEGLPPTMSASEVGAGYRGRRG